MCQVINRTIAGFSLEPRRFRREPSMKDASPLCGANFGLV